MSHAPRQLLSVDGNTADTTQYAGKCIAAFCGLGNSDGFRHTLTAAGYDLIGFRSFADHHRYTRDDIVSLNAWLQQLPQATAVLCTLKDLVKLEATQLAGRPLWALEIGLQIEAGHGQLETRLKCVEEKGKCVFSAR
jgi:tetraacyldisaccharide 4'-kinase